MLFKQRAYARGFINAQMPIANGIDHSAQRHRQIGSFADRRQINRHRPAFPLRPQPTQQNVRRSYVPRQRILHYPPEHGLCRALTYSVQGKQGFVPDAGLCPSRVARLPRLEAALQTTCVGRTARHLRFACYARHSTTTTLSGLGNIMLQRQTVTVRSDPDCSSANCGAPQPACVSSGWSSPIARQAHNLKAAGSNPAPATTFIELWRQSISPRRVRVPCAIIADPGSTIAAISPTSSISSPLVLARVQHHALDQAADDLQCFGSWPRSSSSADSDLLAIHSASLGCRRVRGGRVRQAGPRVPPCAPRARPAVLQTRCAEAVRDGLDEPASLRWTSSSSRSRQPSALDLCLQPVPLRGELGDERRDVLGLHQPVLAAPPGSTSPEHRAGCPPIVAGPLPARGRAGEVVAADVGHRAVAAAAEAPCRSAHVGRPVSQIARPVDLPAPALARMSASRACTASQSSWSMMRSSGTSSSDPFGSAG